MDSASRIRFKTRIFTIIVVLSNALGNLFLTWGLRQWGGELALSPLGYVRAIFNPWVGLGVALLILWLLSRMTLLSWADLSYVLPVTAIGYVVSAIFGHVFLNEQISGQRWAGTLFIVAGIALVGRTAPKTTGESAP
jgi:drug/metabolite transporter (DMT)-like permease